MQCRFFVSEYSPDKARDIENLWLNQYDLKYALQRTKLFRWLTEENPFNSGKCPYYLLSDNEKVIGMLGHMPVEFRVNGQKKMGRMSHDTFLSKEYRGRSLGGILLNEVTQRCPDLVGALWFNEPNYKLYAKNEWLDIPGFHAFIKVMDASFLCRKNSKAILKVFNPILVGLLKFLEFRSVKRKYDGLEIREVELFNSNVDDFFEKVASEFGIIVSRTHGYLNWKFNAKPFSNYKRFAAYRDEDDFRGYIVIKSEPWEGGVRGRILDLLAYPKDEETIGALIHRALVEFNKQQTNYVDAVFSFGPFCKVLKSFGFIKSRKPLRFMVKNWESQFEERFIRDIKTWFITASDGDGDAWSVDIQQ